MLLRFRRDLLVTELENWMGSLLFVYFQETIINVEKVTAIPISMLPKDFETKNN